MNELVAAGGVECIATLEDLGRYLRGLRELRRVTQESLSTRTGAFAQRKIVRSRISEIENARRDRVSERELRTYLCGLKCAPRHIDQIVAVLTQCTATPAGESPAGSAVTGLSSAALEALPAAVPQPPGHRPRRRRIALVPALAQVVVALAGLGAGFFLRGESGSQPTASGGHVASSVPHRTLPMEPDAVDVIKAATFPGATPLPDSQRSPARAESRNWLASRGSATGRDATQRARTQPLIAGMSAAPCGVGLAEQLWPEPALPGPASPGLAFQCFGRDTGMPGVPDVRGHGVASDWRRAGADSGPPLPDGPLSEPSMDAG
ncbi:MAG: helix-turn-helix domain-containing protein [Pseudonocardiaceae bacterium]